MNDGVMRFDFLFARFMRSWKSSTANNVETT